MDESKPFWEQSESRRLEFKEAWPKGDQIARTVVAFANGAGGKIVFGVKNKPREIIGIADDELFALEEQVANHIFDRCTPTIIPEIYIQNVEGNPLLVVEIFSGFQKPYFLKNKGKRKGTYVRIGSVNRLASEETLVSLERDKRKISYDEVVVYEFTAEQLNLKRFIADYTARSGKPLSEEKLQNMGLFVPERGTLFPTHAAILLSEAPARKRFFPYAKIECARFKGTETKIFLDQATIAEPVYAVIEPCMAFIKRNIALGSRIGEIYREDRWEYPLEAVREAVINAVIHRDYAIQGSDIKVAIFDDMLEITSPGPLPDNLPPDALGTGRSEIRNRILAPIFKEMKLIEAWGTGIRKMQSETAKYPEIDLVLQEIGHAFQVRFIKKEALSTIDETHVTPQDEPHVTPQVLQLLSVLKGAEDRDTLQRALGLKARKNFRLLYLVPALDAGLIEMTIPDKPRSSKQKYRLTEQGKLILKKLRYST
ncbi:MAG: putative DNA binding domain-containing protein [Desulfobacterales bacterium]|nr:putative DNA binding domain-containing protein [Desulfobacterales bacterium]